MGLAEHLIDLTKGERVKMEIRNWVLAIVGWVLVILGWLAMYWDDAPSSFFVGALILFAFSLAIVNTKKRGSKG